jgi:hypothetical protein
MLLLLLVQLLLVQLLLVQVVSPQTVCLLLVRGSDCRGVAVALPPLLLCVLPGRASAAQWPWSPPVARAAKQLVCVCVCVCISTRSQPPLATTHCTAQPPAAAASAAVTPTLSLCRAQADL